MSNTRTFSFVFPFCNFNSVFPSLLKALLTSIEQRVQMKHSREFKTASITYTPGAPSLSTGQSLFLCLV